MSAGVRKQPAEQMHITLRFLGETSAAKTEVIKTKLAAGRVSAFTVRVEGAGAFPEKGRPKIIWAGVEKTKLLMRLQQRIEEVCVSSGFAPEKRAFTPHVTIGKVKKARTKKVRKWINQHKKLNVAEFYTDRFVLYESRPKGGGVVHEAVEEYEL